MLMLMQRKMNVRVAVLAARAGERMPVFMDEVAFRKQALVG